MANITDSSAPLQSAISHLLGPVQLVLKIIIRSLSFQKLSQHDLFSEDGIVTSILGDFGLWWCEKGRDYKFSQRPRLSKLDRDICVWRNWSETCESVNRPTSYGLGGEDYGCKIETSLCCDCLGLTTGDWIVMVNALVYFQPSKDLIHMVTHFAFCLSLQIKGRPSRCTWGGQQSWCRGAGDSGCSWFKLLCTFS